MFPLPLFYYFEMGALLTSIVFFQRIKGNALRWLVPFLFLMVCTEFAARYIRKELSRPNSFVFNISIPAEYFFYGLLIASLCSTPQIRKAIFLLSCMFLAYAAANLLFLQGFETLNTNTLKAGSVLMLVCSIMGLIDLFRSDNFTLLKSPLFWICTGVLFFNSGEFLYFFLYDTFLKNKWDQTSRFFSSINNKLIYILYTCISIAIICSGKPQRQKKA